MTFQEKLYRLRKERGLSQERLARELGVSRQAISRWELGEVVPDTANVLALCRVFGVAADTLLREDLLSAREPEPADGEAEPAEPEKPDASQAEEERRRREQQELQRAVTFQERLYRLRKERGFSQERLARELGVSRQAISRWELGEVMPDTANVLALCRVFGVAADTLLREDPLPDREPEPADGETEPESGVTAGSTDPEEAEDLQAEEERRKREKQELQRDILRTNLGLIVRYAELAAFVALHSWLATDEPSWLFSFLVWFVLSLTGVIWWNHGWYLREGGSRALLGWDTLTVVLAAFIPRMLSGLPGIWGILPGVIPGALVVVGPIRTLLLDHYRVEPPGRRKES